MKVIDLKGDMELFKEVREYFPHQSIRKYQGDLANSIYQALISGEKNIVVEAPTGLGKGHGTVGVYPAVEPYGAGSRTIPLC